MPGINANPGIRWQNDIYINVAVAFGWVHGSAAFQHVSDAVTFIPSKAGVNMVAYIDDYVIISPRATAQRHFDTLASILSQLGLPSNQDKQTPPCRALTCLGIKIDLDDNTLSINPDKLASIYSECQAVANRHHLTKRAFQSLLGKLLCINKCVIPARIFINRMLALFRENSNKRRIYLTPEFHKDLTWFLVFLPQFNGVTYIKKSDLPYNQVYATPIFDIYGIELKIVHLKMLKLLIALKLWAHEWSHSVARFFVTTWLWFKWFEPAKPEITCYLYVSGTSGLLQQPMTLTFTLNIFKVDLPKWQIYFLACILPSQLIQNCSKHLLNLTSGIKYQSTSLI